MSTTDHTLTDAERAMFERIEDTGDTQGLTWRVQELLAARLAAAEESASRVALANRLATAEAEKEALRAESSIARMDAERYAGKALDALTTLITDVYTSHPLDIARVILVSDFMAQVKRDAYDAGFHDGRAER